MPATAKIADGGKSKMAALVISNWNQIMDFLKQIAMLQAATT